jgi:hypothetical protein
VAVADQCFRRLRRASANLGSFQKVIHVRLYVLDPRGRERRRREEKEEAGYTYYAPFGLLPKRGGSARPHGLSALIQRRQGKGKRERESEKASRLGREREEGLTEAAKETIGGASGGTAAGRCQPRAAIPLSAFSILPSAAYADVGGRRRRRQQPPPPPRAAAIQKRGIRGEKRGEEGESESDAGNEGMSPSHSPRVTSSSSSSPSSSTSFGPLQERNKLFFSPVNIMVSRIRDVFELYFFNASIRLFRYISPANRDRVSKPRPGAVAAAGGRRGWTRPSCAPGERAPRSSRHARGRSASSLPRRRRRARTTSRSTPAAPRATTRRRRRRGSF